MNLNYIREFATLTQVGKFHDAADMLYLSQSTLSKHIMTLEKELGSDLFVRSKRQKQQLTTFGKSFLPYALQLTNIYNEMNAELLQFTDKNAQKITIGSSPIVTLYTIFSFLEAFLQNYPDIQLEIIDAPQDKLFELLRTGTCDLIVVQEKEKSLDGEFCKLLYAQDEMSVLLPKDHPLAAKESVSFAEIASERFIQVSQSPMSKTLESLSSAQGIDVQEQISLSRPSAVIDLIESHIGISIMPKFPAEHFSNGRLAIVDLEPHLPATYYMLYPKSKNLPASTNALLEFVAKKSI